MMLRCRWCNEPGICEGDIVILLILESCVENYHVGSGEFWRELLGEPK